MINYAMQCGCRNDWRNLWDGSPSIRISSRWNSTKLKRNQFCLRFASTSPPLIVRNYLLYSKILSKFLQVQMIKDSFIEYYNWQSIPCMIENYTCNENKIKTASLPRTMNKLYSWNKSLSISSHLLPHPNEFNFLKSITDLYPLSLPITTTIKKTHTLPN